MRRWLSTIRGFAVVLLSTAIVFVAAVSSVMAQEADVGVAKSGPATAAPDSDVAYSVTVFNLGLDAAADEAPRAGGDHVLRAADHQTAAGAHHDVDRRHRALRAGQR